MSEEFLAAKKKTRRSARSQQRELEMGWEQQGNVIYEHAVLVTNMTADILTLAQHYRGRGDAGEQLDEPKNQWGWLGFTTHDHARSEMMTLFVALSTTGGACSRDFRLPIGVPQRLLLARCYCIPLDARPVTAIGPP